MISTIYDDEWGRGWGEKESLESGNHVKTQHLYQQTIKTRQIESIYKQKTIFQIIDNYHLITYRSCQLKSEPEKYTNKHNYVIFKRFGQLA